MEWDLGIGGITYLAAMSLVVGVVAQLYVGRAFHRMWLLAGGMFFVLGILISEAWFGSATEDELQPIIDGLSRDETLLGLIPVAALVVVLKRRHQRPRPARHA